MQELNYGAIVKDLYERFFDRLNSWEKKFLYDMYVRTNYNFLTDRQKGSIININRKYRAHR